MLIDEIIETYTCLDYLLSCLVLVGIIFSVVSIKFYDDKVFEEWQYLVIILTACFWELLVSHLYYPGFFKFALSMMIVKVFGFPIAFRYCDYLFPWKEK